MCSSPSRSPRTPWKSQILPKLFFYSTLIDFQFRGEISQLAKPTDLPSPYQRFTKPRTFVILLFNLCQINIAHLRLPKTRLKKKDKPRLKSRSAFETIAWSAIRIKVRLKTFYINRFCTCMNLWSQGHFIVLETKCFCFLGLKGASIESLCVLILICPE